MIVSGASAWMEAYHDRMPVLLSPQDLAGWLYGTLGAEALCPVPATALRGWPVSKRVNATDVDDDDPTLLEPLCPPQDVAGVAQ
jgi:putative SOS response-associated peptidase YedK